MIKKNIPGWCRVPLGELSYRITKGTTPTSLGFNFTDKGILFVKVESISDQRINHALCTYIDPDADEALARSRLQEDDILFSIAGTLGRIGIVHQNDLPANTNQAVSIIRLVKPILPEYIAHFLSSHLLEARIREQRRGVGLQNLNLKQVSEFEISLPPLNEQRRIVGKIEALKARSQGVKEELEAIAPLLDQFRQSVLAAAFRGDLTADWREKNPDVEPASSLLHKILKAHELAGGHKRGNAAPPTDGVHNLTSEAFPKTWKIAELKDICEPGRPITYGILKPGFEVHDGVPYIRVADFPNDQLNPETIRKTSFEIDVQYARSRLKTGDLLLSIRGTVGRLCKIPPLLNGANITQDSARLSIQTDVFSDYVFWFLKAKATQERMQKAIKGVAVRGINIGDVRALQIPLPPYLEQQELVRRVEALLKTADCIKQQYQESKAYLAQLDQSILAKAFRGELVPQDPNDETASVLLERIRAEREKLDTNKKAKSKTENKSRKAKPEPEPKQLSFPGFE
ncbi:restriction endonuclease subunit S [Microcoleus sp. FACHB-831]|uniref:restriction endonuclease subunit S n=1 Tax=Microcoleus sp. FACHB-831 TaxID=2692827 RepID=UPI001688985D|nr:restriction endonuclease subunit S [Microcoleus sp. FACHB-831]MBD1924235.1 restriction endonuclease subunit S [Microcoleus sp. FACHB-831]